MWFQLPGIGESTIHFWMLQSALDYFESVKGEIMGVWPSGIGCGFLPCSRDLAWMGLGFHLPGQCKCWAEGSRYIKGSFAPWQGCLLPGWRPHRKSLYYLAPVRSKEGCASASWNPRSIAQARSARAICCDTWMGGKSENTDLHLH